MKGLQGRVEKLTRGACAALWFAFYWVLAGPLRVWSIFGYFVTFPLHCIHMFNECIKPSGEEFPVRSLGLFEHRRAGLLTLFFFPLWLPVSILMALVHLASSTVVLLTFNWRGALFHFQMAEESFRFYQFGSDITYKPTA